MLLNRASVAWSGAECPCNVDILVHYFKFVRITKTFFTCFAVSRYFDVPERRVFFRKTAWRAAVSFPGCFLAGMNRKMCVAEILVLKSVKFISGRFNYIVNFALYKIISLKRFFSENKKLHYAA